MGRLRGVPLDNIGQKIDSFGLWLPQRAKLVDWVGGGRIGGAQHSLV